MARKLPFLQRTLRRARVYGRRVLRGTVLPGPVARCAFMHMPKCGGTSVAEALYATVPLGQGVSVLDAVSTRRAAAMLAFGVDDPLRCHEDLPDARHVFDLRERLMLTHMAWGTALVHGHFLYSARAEAHFAKDYRLVTLLREPETRMLSNFRMAARAGVVPDDIDGYLAGPVAINHARVYLRYLSGEPDLAQAGPALLDLALSRLERFAVIGFLDDLPRFQADYARTFGVALRIHSYNRGEGAAPRLSEAQAARVRDLCAPDRAIYDRARALTRG